MDIKTGIAVVQVSRCAGMQVYKCAGVKVCRRAGLPVCGCEGAQGLMCNGFCSGFCSVFGRPRFHILLPSSDLCGIFRLVFQRIVAHFSNEVFRALNVADRRSPVRRAS